MTNAPGQQGRFAGRPTGGPRHVYLVEDDPVERARVTGLLEAAGYEVIVVPTLEAAVTQRFWAGDPAKVMFARRRRPDG